MINLTPIEPSSLSLFPLIYTHNDGVVQWANDEAKLMFAPLSRLMGVALFALFPELLRLSTKLANNNLLRVEEMMTITLGAHDKKVLVWMAKNHEETGYMINIVDLQDWVEHWHDEWSTHLAALHDAQMREWAHEVNNPLSALLAATQLLQKELTEKPNKPDSADEMVTLILGEINRLRNLMQQSLPQNTRPKHSIHSTINSHEPIERALRLFALEFQGVDIIRDYDVSLPPIHAEDGEADYLQQAVLNLLRNAGQAMQRHGTNNPTLTVRTRIARSVLIHGKRHKMAVQWQIVDNGPGFPPALTRLLGVMELAGNAETRAHNPTSILDNPPDKQHQQGIQGGQGIGLSISRNIIRAHGGSATPHRDHEKTWWEIVFPVAL